MAIDYLFVYGTLRAVAGHPLNVLLKSSSRFQGKATFQGKLYLIDTYPGAISSNRPDDRIFGDVYLLNDPERILQELDQYEEVGPDFNIPNEYVRRKETVILESGRKVKAWIYLYNRSTEGLSLIESGDYCGRV